jgi:hypothetical protein
MKNNRSTYSLLLNADAEEKGRSIFESVIYSFVVLCTAVAVWQFASGDVVLPTGGSTASSMADFAAANSQQVEPARG